MEDDDDSISDSEDLVTFNGTDGSFTRFPSQICRMKLEAEIPAGVLSRWPILDLELAVKRFMEKGEVWSGGTKDRGVPDYFEAPRRD